MPITNTINQSFLSIVIARPTTLTANANNVKYFSSRSSPFYDNDTVGGDGYWKQAIGGNYLYTSSVNAGTTLRFAIEYFHYDNSYHESMMINRSNSGGSSSSGGNRAYQGSNATTLTVMEIKA